MIRIHGTGHREAINTALELLTPRLQHRLTGIGFVTGVDPIFIGLRDWGTVTFYDGSVASYSDLSATWMGKHHQLLDDQTTIVIPHLDAAPISTMAHELGHALHRTVDFDRVGDEPTTEYSMTNAHEMFAVAFELWLSERMDHRARYYDGEWQPWARHFAPRHYALFDRLA